MKKALILFSLLLFISCKKGKTDPAEAEQTQLAKDESMLTRETDLVMDDVNDVFTSSRFGDGSNSVLCGITVDSSQIASGKIILTYNPSTVCVFGSRKRSGTVEAQFSPVGNRWQDAGSSIQIRFINYKVTRTIDDVSLGLNGTKKITNINGGLIRKLTALSDPVVHAVRADLRLTFDDGTERSWRAARKRSISVSGGYLHVKIEGDTTVADYPNVATWGTTRRGSVFYVALDAPLHSSNRCYWDPHSGVQRVLTIFREFKITYGVDNNGNPADDCPYGYKIEWTNSKGDRELKVIGY